MKEVNVNILQDLIVMVVAVSMIANIVMQSHY